MNCLDRTFFNKHNFIVFTRYFASIFFSIVSGTFSIDIIKGFFKFHNLRQLSAILKTAI